MWVVRAAVCHYGRECVPNAIGTLEWSKVLLLKWSCWARWAGQNPKYAEQLLQYMQEVPRPPPNGNNRGATLLNFRGAAEEKIRQIIEEQKVPEVGCVTPMPRCSRGTPNLSSRDRTIDTGRSSNINSAQAERVRGCFFGASNAARQEAMLTVGSGRLCVSRDGVEMWATAVALESARATRLFSALASHTDSAIAKTSLIGLMKKFTCTVFNGEACAALACHALCEHLDGCGAVKVVGPQLEAVMLATGLLLFGSATSGREVPLAQRFPVYVAMERLESTLPRRVELDGVVLVMGTNAAGDLKGKKLEHSLSKIFTHQLEVVEEAHDLELVAQTGGLQNKLVILCAKVTRDPFGDVQLHMGKRFVSCELTFGLGDFEAALEGSVVLSMLCQHDPLEMRLVSEFMFDAGSCAVVQPIGLLNVVDSHRFLRGFLRTAMQTKAFAEMCQLGRQYLADRAWVQREGSIVAMVALAVADFEIVFPGLDPAQRQRTFQGDMEAAAWEMSDTKRLRKAR